MSKASRLSLMASALGAGILSLAPLLSGPAMAQVAAAGYDYLQTVDGTSLGGVALVGNPLAPGLTMEAYPTNTDTIVQRGGILLNDPNGGPIQITALSLMTPGGGTYVTLDPNHLADDVGKMVISGTPAGGTFTSFFDVFFDVCSGGWGANGVGCGNGQTISAGEASFTQGAAPWTGTPANADFFNFHVAGNAIHTAPAAGDIHSVDPAPGPVPGVGLFGLAFLSLAGVATRARRWLNG